MARCIPPPMTHQPNTVESLVVMELARDARGCRVQIGTVVKPHHDGYGNLTEETLPLMWMRLDDEEWHQVLEAMEAGRNIAVALTLRPALAPVAAG